MGKYLFAIYICCCAVFCSCSDDNDLPDLRPAAKGEFTDERDGNTYEWIRTGNLEWMTSNLKYYAEAPYYESFYDLFGLDRPDQIYSHFFDTDFEGDYNRYGNMYTWEEANTLCPEGWRLPTDGDWKNLEMALGMPAGEADSEGWRGSYEATLLRQGEEGLGMALQLGGNVSDSGPWAPAPYLSFVGEFGYYWTASEIPDNGLQDKSVWFRKIFADYSTIYRGHTTLSKLMRVRCCRDIMN